MTSLALYVLLGVVLFLSFLVMGLRGGSTPMPDSRAVDAVTQIVGLEGLSFAHFEVLLNGSDYEMLRSHPMLRTTAEQFRRDRGELAILWIGLLLNDLRKLWRFRRFLVGRGAPADFGEEAAIFGNFVFSLLSLQLLRIFIRCFGPFAFSRATADAKRVVEIMSYGPARILSRVPNSGWAEIAQDWAGGTA